MGNNQSLLKYHKENQNNPNTYFTEEEENKMRFLYKKNSENKFTPKKFQNVRFILSQAQEEIQLGEGSFGKVIKKRLTDKHGPINCAIKLFKKSENKRKEERIQNEIKILKKCNHENIIQFYGEHKFKNDPNKFALFFECAFISLKDHLKNKPKIDIYHLRKYCFEILKALQYLHFNNICHGDIKPENIMLTETGKVKLIDFGCSRKIEKPVKGTEMFLPPEFGLDQRFTDLGRDIWAFGITFYELLGGDIKILMKLRRNNFLENDSERTELFKNVKHCIVGNDFLKCCIEENPLLRKNVFQLLKHPFLEPIADKQSMDTYTSVVTKNIDFLRECEKNKSNQKSNLNSNLNSNIKSNLNSSLKKNHVQKNSKINSKIFKNDLNEISKEECNNLNEIKIDFDFSIEKKNLTKENENVSIYKSHY